MSIVDRIESLRRQAIDNRYAAMSLPARDVLALADEIARLRLENSSLAARAMDREREASRWRYFRDADRNRSGIYPADSSECVWGERLDKAIDGAILDSGFADAFAKDDA